MAIVCNNVREVILVSSIEGTKLYASYSLYDGVYQYVNGILNRNEALNLTTHKDLEALKISILKKLDII